jgi:fructokinase
MPAARTVVSWGELLWDLFPDQRRLGGASANVAYHAAQLGEKAVLVSRVGNDEFGALALRALERAGVATEFVQIDPGAPTGTVHVELIDGEPRYRIATSVAWDRIEWRPELAPVMNEASAVCFGTLAQREPLAFDILERALGHTRAGTVRLCDLNVRPPFASRQAIDRALGLASALKLNEAELGERGLAFVAVTLGARGSLLATPSARHAEPAAPLAVGAGDPVGAGDAFTAVLAHGLPRALPLPELAARANRYAAHVASHPGAMPPPPAWLTDTC